MMRWRLKIIRQLNVKGAVDELLGIAIRAGQSTRSVQAVDAALENGASSHITELLTAAEPSADALALSKSIGLSDRRETTELLGKVLQAPSTASQIKIDASLGLARTGNGQKMLIEAAKAGKLPGEAKALVGATLREAKDESIRNAARELFPPMKTSGAPLAPVTELVKKKGDVKNGKISLTRSLPAISAIKLERKEKTLVQR